MRDENLIAIAMGLSEVSTDILMYLEGRKQEQVRTTDIYMAMMTHSGAGLQKVQDELQQLRLSLLVKTSQDKKDYRIMNIELTPFGQRLLDLGRNIEEIPSKPVYELNDEAILDIGRLLDKEHEKILKCLQEDSIEMSIELYEKSTKKKLSYRVFQGKVAALVTALFIEFTKNGPRKSYSLSKNGQRYFELKGSKGKKPGIGGED